jgi:hypothetical protein
MRRVSPWPARCDGSRGKGDAATDDSLTQKPKSVRFFLDRRIDFGDKINLNQKAAKEQPTTEPSVVRRFLLQTRLTVTVLAGPAVMDLAPGARADYIRCSAMGQYVDLVRNDCAAAPTTNCRASQQALSPSPVVPYPLNYSFLPVSCGPARDNSSTGAGANPTSSSNSHAGLLGERTDTPLQQIGLLLLFQGPPPDDTPPSSIFRPPRPSSRS